MSLSRKIGFRYTGSRSKNQLVSFLSGISILGLVVGVALLLLVLSIMNGFDRELREQILGLLPQASIYHKEGIENWPALSKEFEKSEGVAGAAPFIELHGLVSFQKKAEPIVVYGVEPSQEQQVSNLHQFIPKMLLDELIENDQGVLLGHDLAQSLGLTVGDELTFIVPSASKTKAPPKFRYLTLLGTLKTNTEIDNTLGIMSLSSASILMASPDRVSGIRLKLFDLFAAREVVWNIIMSLEKNYYGTSWMSSHGNLYHAIQMSKRLVGLLMSLIVAIAAFNVVSALVMVVVEKEGDIAILKTLGMSRWQIMKIFMVQGSCIGLIGTSLGVLLGLGLSLVVEHVVRFIEALFSVKFLQSDVYPLTYLPTQIYWTDVVQIVVVALFLSFVATLYPAWRASRIEPAIALRYE